MRKTKYYIWAAETNYEGLYDMSESSVEEFDSLDDAVEFGREMAYDVINSYDCTMPSAEELLEPEYDDADWYEGHEVVCVWPIRDEYQNSNIDDLNMARINMGHVDFVSRFCNELVISI